MQIRLNKRPEQAPKRQRVLWGNQPVQNKKLVRANSKSNLLGNTVMRADDEVGTIIQIDQENFVKRKLRRT